MASGYRIKNKYTGNKVVDLADLFQDYQFLKYSDSNTKARVSMNLSYMSNRLRIQGNEGTMQMRAARMGAGYTQFSVFPINSSEKDYGYSGNYVDNLDQFSGEDYYANPCVKGWYPILENYIAGGPTTAASQIDVYYTGSGTVHEPGTIEVVFKNPDGTVKTTRTAACPAVVIVAVQGAGGSGASGGGNYWGRNRDNGSGGGSGALVTFQLEMPWWTKKKVRVLEFQLQPGAPGVTGGSSGISGTGAKNGNSASIFSEVFAYKGTRFVEPSDTWTTHRIAYVGGGEGGVYSSNGSSYVPGGAGGTAIIYEDVTDKVKFKVAYEGIWLGNEKWIPGNAGGGVQGGGYTYSGLAGVSSKVLQLCATREASRGQLPSYAGGSAGSFILSDGSYTDTVCPGGGGASSFGRGGGASYAYNVVNSVNYVDTYCEKGSYPGLGAGSGGGMFVQESRVQDYSGHDTHPGGPAYIAIYW